jgi:hypothetical protein
MHQALRKRDALCDGGNCYGIGGRQDCCERERDRKRYGRDHPVDEKAHADHRENDQPKCQLDDGLAILEQFLSRDAPTIQE